jgi:hypothetical protein
VKLVTKGLLTLPVGLALCCAQFLIAEATRSASSQIQVALGDVKDVRPTAKEPGKLEVTLNISGGEFPSDAKGCRIAVTKAIDDTGLDLLVPENTSTEFRAADVNSKFVVKLKNPERKAGHIQEISGNVEVFVPQNDPAAVLTLDWSRKQAGRPIQSPGLKSAGLEITAWTAEQSGALLNKIALDDTKQFEAQEVEAIKRLQTQASERPGVDPEKAIANLKAAFAKIRQSQVSTHGNAMTPKPKDVVFSIDDPGKRLIGFEFRDPLNNRIKSSGTTEFHFQYGSQVQEERLRMFHFAAPVPTTGKLLIFVATPESLTKTPFTLTDIALP